MTRSSLSKCCDFLACYDWIFLACSGYEYNRWWCLGILFICYFSTLQSCRIHLLPFLFSSPLQLPLPLSISSFSSLLSFLFKSYIVPIQLLVSKPRVLVVSTTKQSITNKKKLLKFQKFSVNLIIRGLS